MRKNKNGFTLTELIVTIALIGVVMIIAFPAIGNLKSSNEDKKYEAYAEVLENAAKIYVDSNSDKITTCAKIEYSELKKYIKNSRVDKNLNCESSYVIVKRSESYNTFIYHANVKCNNGKSWAKDGTLGRC